MMVTDETIILGELAVDLLESLQQFDGKHVAPLESLSEELTKSSESVEQLLNAVGQGDVKVDVAATWVLKRWHDEQCPFLQSVASDLVAILQTASHWEVQLHVLQILSDLDISDDDADRLEQTLSQLGKSQNKLVRAWTFGALATIGDQHEAARHDVLSKLHVGENDAAASVRARIRKIRKRYRWAREF